MILSRVDPRELLARDLPKRCPRQIDHLPSQPHIPICDVENVVLELEQAGLTFPIRSSMLSTILLLSISDVCVIFGWGSGVRLSLFLFSICSSLVWSKGLRFEWTAG